MGQRARTPTAILGFDGWKVTEVFFESASGEVVQPVGTLVPLRGTRLVLVVERRWLARCSQCGGPCRDGHERCPCRRFLSDRPTGLPCLPSLCTA